MKINVADDNEHLRDSRRRRYRRCVIRRKKRK